LAVGIVDLDPKAVERSGKFDEGLGELELNAIDITAIAVDRR